MKERRAELLARGLCACCARSPTIPEQAYCKACSKRRRERARGRLLETRQAVLKMYGESCACCGETEFAFLTVDHKNNDGWKERKPNGKNFTSAEMICRNLLKKKRKDIQILCYNCNCAKQRMGYCPHRPKHKIKRRIRGARRKDGEHNPVSKLTNASVLYIRNSNQSHAALARELGVSDVCIRNARIGKTWKEQVNA